MFYSHETNFDISTKTFISTGVTIETINCKTNLEKPRRFSVLFSLWDRSVSLTNTKQFVFPIITLFREEETISIMRCDRSHDLFKRLILH